MRKPVFLSFLCLFLLLTSGFAAKTEMSEDELKELVDKRVADRTKDWEKKHEKAMRVRTQRERAWVKDQVERRTEAVVLSQLEKEEKKTPVGFIHLAGSNTTIKFGGYIKLDTTYDLGPFSGDSTNLPGFPLRKFDAAAMQRGFVRMQGRETRFTMTVLTPTQNLGEIKAYLEGDFYGTTNFGASASRSSPASAGAWNFRVRLAYVDFAGFHVGQDWTTFMDMEALGSFVELNGPTGTAVVRQPMLRYTFSSADKKTTFSIAAENPFTDYIDQTGTPQENSSTYLGTTGSGFQTWPDVIIGAKHKGSWGHVSVRGVVRDLQIDSVTAAQHVKIKRVGWGAALSAKLNTPRKGSVYMHANIGRGLGHYIFDLPWTAMAYNSVTNVARTQSVWSAMVGIEHYWNERLRSNLAFGHSEVNLAKNIVPQIISGANKPTTKYLNQLIVNSIFSPVPFMDVGLEYHFIWRKATGNLHGIGHRIQLGIKCKLDRDTAPPPKKP